MSTLAQVCCRKECAYMLRIAGCETWIDTICRLVYLNYREDGVTPYLIIWKHGLKEEKV